MQQWCRNKSVSEIRKSGKYKAIPRGYDKSRLNKTEICHLIDALHDGGPGQRRSQPRRSSDTRTSRRDRRNTRNTRSASASRTRRNHRNSDPGPSIQPRRRKKWTKASRAPAEDRTACANEESYLTLEPFENDVDIVTLSLDSKTGHCYARDKLVAALMSSRVRRSRGGLMLYRLPMPFVWIDDATFTALATRSTRKEKLHVCKLRKTRVMFNAEPVYTCAKNV